MGFSNDVITTALQELLPGHQETWTKFHPVFDALVVRGNKTKSTKGPYKEFGLVPEGPGRINTIRNGDEHLVGGRRQSGVRGNTYAATLMYVWDLPEQDLREAEGPADIVEIIKKYPENGLADFQEVLARQIVMADGPEAGAFFTLNGDATYDPKGFEARSGYASFGPALLQTSTVFGVKKNSIQGWHNQYANITSMGGNGLKRLRKAYWDASQEGAKAMGNVDLMFSERDSFDNYIDTLEQKVEFIKPKSDIKGGDAGALNMREGVRFAQAIWYPEPHMDRSKFTTPNALNGVVYGLHSAYLHCYTQGSDKGGGDFSFRGPKEAFDQDLSRYTYLLAMGFYSDNLRCMFTVTGGANE